MLLTAASCGKETDEPHPIVGAWSSPQESIQFFEDGTFRAEDHKGKYVGRYRFEENGSLLVFLNDQFGQSVKRASRFGFLESEKKLVIEQSFSGTVSLQRIL